MEDLRFKVGLIGCGIAAQFFHAPAYRLLKDSVKVVAVADPNNQNRDLVSQILPEPVNAYISFEEMLRVERVDMVDIMLPHHLYVEVVSNVSRHCKNILIEKPFAKDMQDARKIINAVKGLNFSVVHNYLYGYRYQDALKRIADGEIGQPFLVRLENLNTGMKTIDSSLTQKWHADSNLSGRGNFHNHGYHLVYLARALMGSEVIKVSATMGHYYGKGDTLDTAIVTLFHENSGISVLQDGWLHNQTPAPVEEILGKKGTLTINSDSRAIESFRKDLKNFSKHIVLRKSPYARSMAACIFDYINAVKTRRELPVTAEEAYKNLKITLTAYESHDCACVVKI